MSKMKQIIAICLVLTMVAFLIGGCTQTQAPAGSSTPNASDPASTPTEEYKPVTITFWNGWSGTDGDVLIDLVDEFNKTNPYKITINMDINPEFMQKFAATVAAGQGPDLILGVNAFKFTYPNDLIDMNEAFEATSLNKEDWVPSYLDSCSQDGKLYVVPFQVTGRYMYWNKDLFEAAGLDPNSPPTTYEQWSEYASKITDSSKNIYGSGLAYSAVSTNLHILQRMGGDFISDDGNGGYKANFEGNAGYAKFLNWFKGMVDKKDNPIETNTDGMMQAGQLGLSVSGAWLNAGMKNSGVNYGVAPLPYDAAGQMNPVTISGFSVTRFASDEAKLACFRFVEWWNKGFESTEDTAVLRWSLECGYPTYYIPLMNDERYLASDILTAMTVDPSIDTKYMGPNSFPEGYLLSNEVINPMVEGVIMKGETPEQAMKEAQASAEKILESIASK